MKRCNEVLSKSKHHSSSGNSLDEENSKTGAFIVVPSFTVNRNERKCQSWRGVLFFPLSTFHSSSLFWIFFCLAGFSRLYFSVEQDEDEAKEEETTCAAVVKGRVISWCGIYRS